MYIMLCLLLNNILSFRLSVQNDRLVGLVVKASASRAQDPEFESRLRRDLKIGNPVATLPGAWRYRISWDRLVWCQYAVTGWDGKFGLQLLSQCGSTYNCLSTPSEIHSHVAGTLINLPTNQLYRLCMKVVRVMKVKQYFLAKPYFWCHGKIILFVCFVFTFKVSTFVFVDVVVPKVYMAKAHTHKKKNK